MASIIEISATDDDVVIINGIKWDAAEKKKDTAIPGDCFTHDRTGRKFVCSMTTKDTPQIIAAIEDVA
jgi:hypothetical protein